MRLLIPSLKAYLLPQKMTSRNIVQLHRVYHIPTPLTKPSLLFLARRKTMSMSMCHHKHKTNPSTKSQMLLMWMYKVKVQALLSWENCHGVWPPHLCRSPGLLDQKAQHITVRKTSSNPVNKPIYLYIVIKQRLWIYIVIHISSWFMSLLLCFERIHVYYFLHYTEHAPFAFTMIDMHNCVAKQ